MNVLVLTNSAWDDRDASNTFSNLLSGWSEAEISSLYMRDSLPNNDVCHHYFKITDKMLLKNLFTPRKIGKYFTLDDHKTVRAEKSDADAKEKKIIAFIHRYNFKFAYTVENILWKHKGWQNRNLDAFLKDRAPEVLFTFAIPSVQRLMLQEYIKKKTGAKTVLFLVDHVCAAYFSSGGKRGKKEAQRMRQMLSNADKIYAISEQLRDVYSEAFGVDISLLRKGCRFDAPVKTVVNDPIRITYAGNLLYGRSEILGSLARAIASINENGQKAILDIYSGTAASKEEIQKLSIESASVFHGACQFEQIKKILSSSDVVLHVESFDKNEIERVKYSFSTKITDALESGSAFLVIGPPSITSVEYPRAIPGVMVIDDLDELENMLRRFLADAGALLKCASETRAYAVQDHGIENIHRQFRSELVSLCKGGMIICSSNKETE